MNKFSLHTFHFKFSLDVLESFDRALLISRSYDVYGPVFIKLRLEKKQIMLFLVFTT